MSEPFDPMSVDGCSVQDLIDRWADGKPDTVFLVDPESGNSLTYGELKAACRSFAGRLASDGIPAGSTIAYALNNGIRSVQVILGSLYGGYLATAVNLVAGQNTISYVLDHSAATIVFVDSRSADLIDGALKASSSVIRSVHADESWFSDDDVRVDSVTDAHDGLLMYTSGTTGVPKGVVHTHRSLLAGGSNTVVAHRIGERDRGLCVLPLYHINAFCVSLMGVLVSGGSLVVPPRFSVSSFWHQLRDHHCTWFSVVPTQISYLIHHAETNGHDRSGLEQLRFGRSASAPLSPDVQQSFEDRFALPIIETMGLTETAAQILSNPVDGVRKIGSPGIAYGNEVIIADEGFSEAPRGTKGEVLVRGPNVMRLYRNNPDATEAAFTSDGWFRTGDLGRMDPEGYVFITGRLKELIIKGGENISPREVDEALYSHPDVIEAAAFARPSSTYGQTVEASVMLCQGSAITEAQLIALCQEKVGTFKAPDRIHFLPELPKGPSGKIQRIKLAEMIVD